MAEPTITAAVIGGLFTTVAAIIGFGVVAFQMGRQGKLTRTQAKESQQREFKTELYRDGVRIARSLSDACSELITYLNLTKVEIELSHHSAKESRAPRVPNSRFPKIMSKYRRFTDALFKFIFLIEERRILDPRIIIFRDAMQASLHEVSQRFPREFQSAVMTALPVDNEDGGIYSYTPPNEEALVAVRSEIDLMSEGLTDCQAYAGDFIIEMQNLLLGEVFDNEIVHRVPIDPNLKVIKLSDYDELQAWIATTPWGQHIKEVNNTTAAKYTEPK